MKKTLIILLLSLFVGGTACGQGSGATVPRSLTQSHNNTITQSAIMPLSETAWAGLLSCEPSNELYTSFSHSALHICDTASGIDVVYNYGTFDFGTPHFVWKFATRTLDYCLSRESYRSFIADYTDQRRCVWEQRLNLSRQEVCNLFLMLEFNYQPEYRWYRYDFFRDNCATRIRDMICKSLDHREIIYPKDDHTGKSYREIVYTTNGNRPWWRFTVDLALGARCDRDRSTWECAFLPLEMMAQFDTLLVESQESRVEPVRDDIVAGSRVKLLEDRREPLKRGVTPEVCFWGLFVIILTLTFFEQRKGWQLKIVDILLFLVPALLSLVALFLWFCSAHWCTKWNFNLLWASPLFFYLSGAALRKRKTSFNEYISTTYKVVAFIQIAMLLALIGMMATGWPQHFNRAILPISLILFTRLAASLLKTKTITKSF